MCEVDVRSAIVNVVRWCVEASVCMQGRGVGGLSGTLEAGRRSRGQVAGRRAGGHMD